MKELNTFAINTTQSGGGVGMDTGEMGFRNIHAAEENVVTRGILLYRRGDSLALNTSAYIVLMNMCNSVYDWPLKDSMREQYMPARLYEFGLENLAEKMSLTTLTQEQAESPNATELLAKKKRAAIQRISDAIRFLRDRGVIKILRKGSPGRSAAYLLCIGTRRENFDVEQYDRECLRMPKMPNNMRPEDPYEQENYVSEVYKSKSTEPNE